MPDDPLQNPIDSDGPLTPQTEEESEQQEQEGEAEVERRRRIRMGKRPAPAPAPEEGGEVEMRRSFRIHKKRPALAPVPEEEARPQKRSRKGPATADTTEPTSSRFPGRGRGRGRGATVGASAVAGRNSANGRPTGALAAEIAASLKEMNTLMDDASKRWTERFDNVVDEQAQLRNRLDRQEERQTRMESQLAALGPLRPVAASSSLEGPSASLPPRASHSGNQSLTAGGSSERGHQPTRRSGLSWKFDPQGRPYQDKTWDYEYVKVHNYPTGPDSGTKAKELARIGARTSQAATGYYFQPGTDLSLVPGHVDTTQGYSITRPGSPARTPVHISPGQPQYFIIPQPSWHEAADSSTRIKVKDSQFIAKDKMQNILFVHEVSDPNVDLNKFGMYPRVDVRTGTVYNPINSPRSSQIDSHQTSRNRGRVNTR